MSGILAITCVSVCVVTVLVALSFVARFDTWRVVAWAQTPLPLWMPFALAMAALMLAVGSYPLATGFGVATAVFVWKLAPSLSRTVSRTVMTPDAKIAHANLLYLNDRHNDALDALLSHDADVITVCELNDAWHEAIENHPVFTSIYPHRVTAPAQRADGIAVYSRHQLRRHAITPAVTKNCVEVVIAHPNGSELRIVTGHPMPPMNRTKTRDWRPSFCKLSALVHGSNPESGNTATNTVVIGDFNAAAWHPSFRILERGLIRVRDRRLGATWKPHPRAPFVARLDHALVSPDVTPMSIRHFDVPGSDHRGIVVELSLANPQ